MNRYSCNTSLLDVLFNTLLVFIALFVVSFTLMNKPRKEKANVEKLGDLIVTVSWPSDRDDDLDIWMRDPQNNVVFFKNRQAGLMYLDRDDVGFRNDVIQTPDGNVKSIGNQEMITVRGIEAGEYVINMHAYKMLEDKPIEATVVVSKVGDPTTVLLARTVTLERTGHEKTVCRLSFDEKGKLVGTSDLECSLMPERQEPTGFSMPDEEEEEEEDGP